MPVDVFRAILCDRRVTNLDAVAEFLPSDSEQLRILQARCLDAERSALRAGRRADARRFSEIARQLIERAST